MRLYSTLTRSRRAAKSDGSAGVAEPLIQAPPHTAEPGDAGPGLPPRPGPQIISVVSTRQRVGASTFAFHLAYELAADRQVLLIDLDEAGGSLAESCHVDGRLVIERSVEQFYIGTAVSAEAIRDNALPITDRRARLQLVAGRRPQLTELGGGQHVILPRLRDGLRHQDVDVVVLDLGACLAYPNVPLQAVATAIHSVSDRVIGVLCSDPNVVQHAVQVMRGVGRELLADFVCWRSGGEWARHIERVWHEEHPGQPIRAWLEWSDGHYNRWLRTGKPSFDVRDTVRRHLRLGEGVPR
jgi:MinD-like ATPase involved in chromosome partitioning or flagellar assembly